MTDKRADIVTAVCVGITVFSSLALSHLAKDAATASLPEKPKEISVLLDSCITYENGLQDILDEYEKNTGIKLNVEIADNTVSGKLPFLIKLGEIPDVVELPMNQLLQYDGLLWDMSDAWENSKEPVKDIIDEEYIDTIKTDGKLYGFPVSKGNATVTYVREDWLEDAGLDTPTNYDEFINMLRAFKAREQYTLPSNIIIPYTAPGLIYVNGMYRGSYGTYLREFYQDAEPGFIYDEKTQKYYDGFDTPAMANALERLRAAYAEELLDADIFDNRSATCIDQLNTGIAGVMDYWAGTWTAKLDDLTKKTDPEARIKAIPPIAEANYIREVPQVYAITNAAQDPEGIFKYFIEYSHDGGEGQLLFTRGVKDKHYYTNDWGNTVPMGYYEDNDAPVEKAFYPPELSVTEWNDPIGITDERILSSLDIIDKYAGSPASWQLYTDDEDAVRSREEIIKKITRFVVSGQISVDEGMEEYRRLSGEYTKAILDKLNQGG